MTSWPLVFLCLFLAEANAAGLNILWINDGRNAVGNATISAMLNGAGDIFAPSVTIGTVSRVEASTNASMAVSVVCDAIDSMITASNPPDMVLDTTFAGRTSDAIKSLTNSLGIPTVSLSYGDKDDLGEWSNLTPDQQKYLLQLRPPGDTMTYIVRQIISQQNITNAAILFDDQFVMDYKYRSLLMNVPVRHLINRMKTTDADIEKHLHMLADVDLNNIFLFSSVANAQAYLTVANTIRMFGNKYSWFMLTKSPISDLKCDCEDISVMSMNVVSLETDKVQNLQMTFKLSPTLPNIDVAFYFDATAIAVNALSSMKNKANSSYTVSKCADYTDTTPTKRMGLDLKTEYNSESAKFSNHYGKVEAVANGANNDYNYGIKISSNVFKKGTRIKQEEIGSWNSKTSETVMKSGKSLDGIAATTVYKVATVIQAPFVMKKNGSDGYEGYCIDLINELKNLMGFEYEIFEARGGIYGDMNEKMEWNGVIRELVDKKADIALGALSVMAERENVVDFTVPYYDLVGITIMMKKPKAPTSLFKFLSVLEDSVWGCILAAYFVTSLLMWIFDRWSPYSYQNNMEKYKYDDEKRYFNLKECLWFCMTSLTPQGGGEAPKNLSGRLVAATWWLFGFIIIASYTANLAAFLTVSRLETPVDSLEDLSKQYKIQYSPQNGSSTMTYFQRMAYIEDKFYEIWKDMSLNDSMSDYERSKLAVWDYPVSDKYTKMWQSMQEAGLPQSFDAAVERVRASPTSSEGYAFLGDATDIRYKVLTDCEFQMVGEEFSRKPYALAVQQGSPLKDQFNDAILRLLNQRKLETLKERWWNQNPKKVVCQDDDDSGGGISIYNIGGVFIVIFVGIGLAIITLVIEYWYYKYKKPANRVDSGNKKFQVKQAMQKEQTNTTFGTRKDYETDYRTGGEANMAPVGNPW